MSIKSIYDGATRRAFVCLLGSLAFAGAACTKPNPKNCGDGSCTDPAFPFCDVDGSVGGEPNSCIAVTCMADQFVACRDDLAITCNAQIKCDKGCDPTVGCRVCDPNQTVCADGKLQTCDANGVVTSSETCALGCFEDQPRCRDIDPSNGLATYLDMVADPPDLDLSMGGEIDTDKATVVAFINGMSVPVAISMFPASPPGGLGLQVIVAKHVRLGDVTISGFEPLAIVATDTITVEGTVRSNAGSVGHIPASACNGGNGVLTDSGVDGTMFFEGASGGGANATNGGKGGDIASGPLGGLGGLASGTQEIVPLLGGCASGTIVANGNAIGDSASGGGALQLASRIAIDVSGTLDARGKDGFAEQGSDRGSALYGGGGGGSVLLEAPEVSLDAAAKILASGGQRYGLLPRNPVLRCRWRGCDHVLRARRKRRKLGLLEQPDRPQCRQRRRRLGSRTNQYAGSYVSTNEYDG